MSLQRLFYTKYQNIKDFLSHLQCNKTFLIYLIFICDLLTYVVEVVFLTMLYSSLCFSLSLTHTHTRARAQTHTHTHTRAHTSRKKLSDTSKALTQSLHQKQPTEARRQIILIHIMALFSPGLVPSQAAEEKKVTTLLLCFISCFVECNLSKLGSWGHGQGAQELSAVNPQGLRNAHLDLLLSLPHQAPFQECIANSQLGHCAIL